MATTLPADTLARPASTSVEVWSTKAIAWLTFFFGLPTGILLVSQNFRRLGFTQEERAYLLFLVIATPLYVLALLLIPGTLGSVAGLAINVLGILFLRGQAEGAVNRKMALTQPLFVDARNGWLGIGIGIVVAACLFGLSFAFSAALYELGF